ncbi:unnamed protein product, partial [Nesidiocoris tenuis]
TLEVVPISQPWKRGDQSAVHPGSVLTIDGAGDARQRSPTVRINVFTHKKMLFLNSGDCQTEDLLER